MGECLKVKLDYFIIRPGRASTDLDLHKCASLKFIVKTSLTFNMLEWEDKRSTVLGCEKRILKHMTFQLWITVLKLFNMILNGVRISILMAWYHNWFMALTDIENSIVEPFLV